MKWTYCYQFRHLKSTDECQYHYWSMHVMNVSISLGIGFELIEVLNKSSVFVSKFLFPSVSARMMSVLCRNYWSSTRFELGLLLRGVAAVAAFNATSRFSPNCTFIWQRQEQPGLVLYSKSWKCFVQISPPPCCQFMKQFAYAFPKSHTRFFGILVTKRHVKEHHKTKCKQLLWGKIMNEYFNFVFKNQAFT